MRLTGFVFLLFATCCTAQRTAEPTEVQHALEAELLNKPLLLRGFPLDDKLEFDKDLKVIGSIHSGSWTVAALEVAVVNVRDDKVELRGNRWGFIFDEKEMSFAKIKIPRSITLIMHGPFYDSPETVIKNVRNKVFLLDPKETAAALPDYWGPYFEGQIDFDKRKKTGRLKKYPPAPDKDARASGPIASTLSTGEPVYFVGGPVKPPKPLHTPDPSYNDFARKVGLTGKSTLVTIIDSAGRPQDIDIEKPLGLGLDDAAVSIVKTWTFKPATKDGHPVACLVNIEVTFDMRY